MARWLMVALMAVAAYGAEPRAVMTWRFDQPGNLQGWSGNGHMKDIKVAGGALSCTCSDWDPFFTSPLFELPTRPDQWIEVDLKCDKAGTGDLFFTPSQAGPYGMFYSDKRVGWAIPGDNTQQTVRIDPYWQAEPQIIRLRLDLVQGQTIAISAIRIMQPGDAAAPSTKTDFGGLAGWRRETDGRRLSPLLAVPLDRLSTVTLRMTARRGEQAKLLWAVDGHNGLQETSFRLRADGRPHTYNLEMTDGHWAGKLILLGLRPSDVDPDDVRVESLALADEPTGAADLDMTYSGPADGINRVGRPARVICRVVNRGGQPAEKPTAQLTAPAGVKVVAEPAPTSAEFATPVTFAWQVTAAKAGPLDLAVKLGGPGAPTDTLRAKLDITTAPAGLAKGAIPPPQPAKTKYRIGTYYFPGWGRPASWAPIDNAAPWRKPLLGWYDEANPEIADWQIKWALEHGISYFLVDWYWNQGQTSLMHWVEGAYAKSRFRGQFQWAVMWANHNPAGSHSEADWRKVTQYWIDHYLKTPEYLKIDGMPAVFIWNPSGIRADAGGSEQAAKWYATSQEMAKAAGLPGIRFVAMNIAADGQSATPIKNEGYWGETHYHGWYGAQQSAPDPRNFPFSHIVDQSPAGWDRRAAAMAEAGMKYLPVADTGWDSRPWHGDSSMVVTGRTAGEFERLLKLAKTWLDAHGQTDLVLGPWNEWGEGSWLEPNCEHGFSLVDAVRKTFCEAGPHTDLIPADVGVGPYDFPVIQAPTLTSWSFDKDGDGQGWGGMMGVRDVAVRDGALRGVTSSTDPALSLAHGGLRAGSFPLLRVKLTCGPAQNAGGLQLFWSGVGGQMTEAASISLPLIADGQPHEYTFRLSENARWRGVIRSLRLDLGSASGMPFAVDSIDFVPWLK